MKKKMCKFSVFIMLITFLFSNMGFEVNAKPYDDVSSNEVTTEESNQKSNNFLNNKTTDSPLSDEIIEGIKERVLKREQLSSNNALYNFAPAAELTESKINPVIVLIKFKGQTDEEAYSDYMIQKIKNCFAGESSSLKDYLKNVSRGRCTVNPYFAFNKGDNNIYVYEAPYTKEHYDPDYNSNYFGDGQELLKDAFAAIKDQIPSDVNLDADSNGDIDAVDFFVPAQTDWATFLWPHMSSIYDGTGKTEVNGAKLSKYNLITTDYFSGSGYQVITHEFMHTLGYPDMYVYGYNTTSLPDPIGNWTMMSGNTGYPTVWERERYGGWVAEEQIPTISKNGSYELSDASKNPETNTIAYKIAIPNSNEFFMVEYRNQNANEYEALVPSTGIIVYRVNPNRYGNGNGNPEVYVLRNSGYGSYSAALTGDINRNSIDLKLESGEDTEYKIEFVKSKDDKATFKLVNGRKLKVDSFTADKKSPIGVADTVSLVANAGDGTGDYTYSFGTIFNGKETYFVKDSTSNSCSFSPCSIFDKAGFSTEAIGKHTLFVDVKDSSGDVVRKTIDNYEVKPLEISSLKANKLSPQTVGTMITINAETSFEASYRHNSHTFTVTKDGVSQTLNNFGFNSVNWTPTEPGIYTITYYVRDYLNQEATKSIQFEVEESDATKTTIYYSGYDNPYIHYRVGNGQWTAAPGVKMEKSDEVSGYPYKITIDLNDANNMTACFNNGNGQWDSNNGRNYTFNVGYYTFSNGKITKIEKPVKKLEISSFTSNVGDKMVSGNQAIFKAQVKNATGNVQYRYSFKNNTTGESGIIRNYSQYSDLAWMMGKEGNYTITVEAKDDYTVTSKSLNITILPYENLKIQSVTSSLGDTFKEGNETTLTINTTGGRGSNYYSITVNGEYILNSDDSNSVNWKPEKAGTYKIVASAREVYGGSSDSYEKTITVTEKSKNVTTIYYKGYENPYIHYSVGGKWTAAPGIKMTPCTDVEGYNYKVEIDLGEATSLTACFNDGHGQWDSNNGKNYTFNVGYYTFSNGKITKIEKTEKKLEISSFTSSVGDKMVSGNQAIFKAQVKNATGNVQYRYSYKNNTTGESGVIRNYSQYSDLAWMMGKEGNYTITVEAKDDQTVTSKSLNITIVPYENLKIQSVTSSLGDTFKEGSETTLTINTTGGKGLNYYSIKVNGEYILNSDESNSVTWKPEKAGTYKIVASAREVYGGSSDSYEKTITVTEKSKNSITIYYKGYDTPYMHYKIGNGVWTSAPGIRMESTNEKPGYTHKLTIDLGDSKDLTACFNNGHGSWDSRNGVNYYFQEAGTYTYSNGSINKIN